MSFKHDQELKNELTELNKLNYKVLSENTKLISTFSKLHELAKGQAEGQVFDFSDYLKALKKSGSILNYKRQLARLINSGYRAKRLDDAKLFFTKNTNNIPKTKTKTTVTRDSLTKVSKQNTPPPLPTNPPPAPIPTNDNNLAMNDNSLVGSDNFTKYKKTLSNRKTEMTTRAKKLRKPNNKEKKYYTTAANETKKELNFLELFNIRAINKLIKEQQYIINIAKTQKKKYDQPSVKKIINQAQRKIAELEKRKSITYDINIHKIKRDELIQKFKNNKNNKDLDLNELISITKRIDYFKDLYKDKNHILKILKPLDNEVEKRIETNLRAKKSLIKINTSLTLDPKLENTRNKSNLNPTSIANRSKVLRAATEYLNKTRNENFLLTNKNKSNLRKSIINRNKAIQKRKNMLKKSETNLKRDAAKLISYMYKMKLTGKPLINIGKKHINLSGNKKEVKFAPLSDYLRKIKSNKNNREKTLNDLKEKTNSLKSLTADINIKNPFISEKNRKIKKNQSILIKQEESKLNQETKKKVDEYMKFFNDYNNKNNNKNKNLESTLNVIQQDIQYILDQIKYLKLQQFILQLKEPKNYQTNVDIINKKIEILNKNLEKMLIDKKATLSKSLSNSMKYKEKIPGSINSSTMNTKRLFKKLEELGEEQKKEGEKLITDYYSAVNNLDLNTIKKLKDKISYLEIELNTKYSKNTELSENNDLEKRKLQSEIKKLNEKLDTLLAKKLNLEKKKKK